MNFLEKNELAQNADFRTKVKISTIIKAGELLASGQEENYHARMFAQTVLSETENSNWLSSMVFQVVANPAITLEATDADLQYTVNANFEKTAKAFYKVS